MKTKFNQFVNEDSFAARYSKEPEKSKNEQEAEINEIIDPITDMFADEGVLSVRNDVSAIRINLTRKYILMMGVPEDSEEMINDFETLVIDLTDALSMKGYYYSKTHISGHSIVLEKD